jgi:hypothetical protein
VDGARILRDHVSACDSLVRELLKYAQTLRHDGRDAQIHALSQYASIMQLFSGTIVLAKAASPPLLPCYFGRCTRRSLT